MKMKLFATAAFLAAVVHARTNSTSSTGWTVKMQGANAPIDSGYYLCTLQCGGKATAWCGTRDTCEQFETEECLMDEAFEVGEYLPYNELEQQCQGYADFVHADQNPFERRDLMIGYFDAFFNMTAVEGEKEWHRRLHELTEEHGADSLQVEEHHHRRLNVIDDIKKGINIISQGAKIISGDPYTLASGIVDTLATKGCMAAVSWLTGGIGAVASGGICNAAKALLRPALDWIAKQGAAMIQKVKDLGTKFVNWVSKGWGKVKDAGKKIWGGVKRIFRGWRRRMSTDAEKPLFMLE